MKETDAVVCLLFGAAEREIQSQLERAGQGDQGGVLTSTGAGNVARERLWANSTATLTLAG